MILRINLRNKVQQRPLLLLFIFNFNESSPKPIGVNALSSSSFEKRKNPPWSFQPAVLAPHAKNKKG